MALPLTHKRILIVEDEQVFRSVLVGYLTSLGAETGEATNGLQALSAVDDFKPDLILCDLAMPEMGGIEFVEHLRLQGADPGAGDLGHRQDGRHCQGVTLGRTGCPAEAPDRSQSPA